MSLPTQYRYKSLDEGRRIRLLHLRPGDETAEIEIYVFEANLDHQPAYEALSYTWGDPKESCLIYCDENRNTLLVTRNCESALRGLRFKTEERTLWIDAICIDQSSIPERNRQVQLMSDIYRQAQRVLAYLGEPSPDSDIGMDFIMQDAEMVSRESRPAVGLGPNNKSSPQQMAIDGILARPYFQRAWILQEIVFAKDIQIILGDRIVSWAAFSRTIFYCGINKEIHLGTKSGQTVPSVVYFREKPMRLSTGKTSSEMPQSLLEFLRDTRQCKATDPRDKIHALLSMSEEKDEPALAPNYSLATRETFLHFAKFLITRDKRLDILCHVQGSLSVHNLPSWTPDWSIPYTSEPLGHKRDLVRPYKASLGLPGEVLFQQNPDVLMANGKIVDTITKVGSVYKLETELPATSLKEWADIVSELDTNRSKDRSASFVDILIAYPQYSGPNVFGRFYPSWRRLNFSGEVLERHENAEAAIFQQQVNRACNGRSLFVTKENFIGLGPAEIQQGDMVVVLLGGSVPFVLRKRESCFTLVGECYVHGLMNGEAIKNSNIDFQMITIS